MTEILTADPKMATKTISDDRSYPYCYSPETGIYHSKHTPVPLPTEPYVDAVSYIFSHKHDGITALIDSSSGVSISYSQLHTSVKAMASGLHQMGIKQGDVVLISLPNSIIFPIVFLGVLSLGAVVAPMNPLSNPLEIEKQTKDCEVKFAFTTPENVDQVSKALNLKAIPVSENVVTGSILHKILSSDPNLAPKPRINQEDTATIMFSSGTTGACKAVVLTHRNMISMVALFVRFEASQYSSSPSKNVYLAVLPMFHIFGLAQFVTGLLSLGTTVVVMKKFSPDEMVKTIARFGVTHFPVVPPLMAAITRKAKSEDVKKGNLFRSLKQVSSGAAPITESMAQEFVQALPHVDLIQGYGLTETTAVASRGYNTKDIKNYTSVGLLAPNSEAKVVDLGSGAAVPPGNAGELWLRSPGVMKEYLNNIEETNSAVDKEGWLHTGDIVTFDQEGYMYVVDRMKEVIKYKGFQISPADLESVLMSHPDIFDAAVAGEADEEAGEIPVAIVVRRRGSELTEGSLMDFVASKVSPYKKIKKVYFTSRVPRSASGKINRKELKKTMLSRL